MTISNTERLAVLIDADNISPKWAELIFTEIASLGEASVRRIYGDFTGTKLKGWVEKFAPLALVPHLQIANTTGKNASDIALVIDGMDLLHSGRVDGFCLISSDSDFTSLASRIREQGLPVFGFGQRKTPEAFRMACKRFIYLENLLPEETEKAPKASKDTTEKSSLLKNEPVTKVVPIVLHAMKNIDSDAEWYDLPPLRAQMVAIRPDFDQRTYGKEKLGELLEASGQFEVDRSTMPARARRKPRKS